MMIEDYAEGEKKKKKKKKKKRLAACNGRLPVTAEVGVRIVSFCQVRSMLQVRKRGEIFPRYVNKVAGVCSYCNKEKKVTNLRTKA